MPVQVKNVLETKLRVGEVVFDKGEVKVLDSIDGGLFPEAIKQGSLKVLEPRVESADFQPKQPAHVEPKQPEAPKQDEKKDEKQPRIESDEIQADSPEAKKGLFGLGKKDLFGLGKKG